MTVYKATAVVNDNNCLIQFEFDGTEQELYKYAFDRMVAKVQEHLGINSDISSSQIFRTLSYTKLD